MAVQAQEEGSSDGVQNNCYHTKAASGGGIVSKYLEEKEGDSTEYLDKSTFEEDGR